MPGRVYKSFFITLILVLIGISSSDAQVTFIPMDNAQTDHLKAYGIAFKALQMGKKVEWLLNYRAGSFAFDSNDELTGLCLIRGVTAEQLSSAELSDIYRTIEVENMERVVPGKGPGDCGLYPSQSGAVG